MHFFLDCRGFSIKETMPSNQKGSIILIGGFDKSMRMDKKKIGHANDQSKEMLFF